MIWTFPLTFLAAGILFSAITLLSHDEPGLIDSLFEPDAWFSMKLFVAMVMMFAVVGAGSFVSHVPVALALNKRLPADDLWLMILLSLAATAASLSLTGLVDPLDPNLDSLAFYSLLLLMVLVPGIVMSLIHVLVAFVPCSFLNRSNPPKTT